MTQTVTVTRGYSRGFVEVEMTRPSACGNCAECGGCAAPREVVRVMARGGAGAKPGDEVIIESRSGNILGLAALVYLMPLALFFAGYAFGAVFGGLGFALGIALIVPLNKLAGKKVVYEVVNNN
ncbi:MAG: SoxR reducing system RseC family protein [Oscillospiraceae bacterium]|nr:SoxR reducing system RseC family protein [Oscillospiraceae bacterium]